MNHPAELALHQYLRNAIDGKSEMSQDIIDKIKEDIGEALDKFSITDFGGWKIDSTHEKERQEISEQMFVYPLIKAVQELSTQVITLQNEVNTLKGE